jgi:hypothetical protein
MVRWWRTALEYRNSGNTVIRILVAENIEEDFGSRHLVRLHDLEWGGNPFIEMLDFCDATGTEIERLLYDLDFALYDSID